MNFKTTVILIILLAVAAGYIAYDRLHGTNEKVADNSPAKVIDIDPTSITALKITPASGKATSLVKQDGKWKLTEPLSASADQFSTDDLIKNLVQFTSKGETEPAPTKYTVEVTSNGKTTKYNIGEKTVIGNEMYIQADGASKADVVSAEVYDRLEKVADDLRDKQLITTPQGDIHQIRVTTTKLDYALAKPGMTWKITQPEPMPGDEQAISDVLFAVGGLRADSFTQPASASLAGFDHPQLVVDYSTSVPATQPTATQPKFEQIVFGNYQDIRKQNVWVKAPGDVIATVPANSLDRLKKTALDLRDKKVVEIDPEAVTEISLQTKKGTTTQPVASAVMLTRALPSTKPASTQPAAKPQAWVIKGHGNANDAKVAELLNVLHPLRAEKFVEKLPTSQPAASYVLKIMTGGLRGMPVTEHEISLIDRGGEQNLLASYNGLNFEVNRSIASQLSADFASK